MWMFMRMKKLQGLLNQGESIFVEFKQSKGKLNKDVFESVCAFLNRNGGHLFLGVNDDGSIVGINEKAVEKVKKDFVTSMNNPQKISPTFYLSVEEFVVEGKSILYIFIPESSQVHRCNGKIFDRNEDGDLDITDNTNLVAAMYYEKTGNILGEPYFPIRSEEHTSELQSRGHLVCRLLLEKKKRTAPEARRRHG